MLRLLTHGCALSVRSVAAPIHPFRFNVTKRAPHVVIFSKKFTTSSLLRDSAASATLPSIVLPDLDIHEEDMDQVDVMKPSRVVEELNRFIVGQSEAKRAVAIAVRNRWRRHRLPESLREEVMPKNILMIGPTGCGKTEIARRLAKLVDAPFIKVEATKFTEVGFHGRDVDMIIRDLVDISIQQQQARTRKKMRREVKRKVETKIIELLIGETPRDQADATFRKQLREGLLDDQKIEIEVSDMRGNSLRSGGIGGANGDSNSIREVVINLDKAFSRGRAEKRKMKVSEARQILEEAEMEKLVNVESIARDAVIAVEQDGIVFIDEIDKICSSGENRYSADASAEGVQRDLLPIIEGCSISTKHGNVNTDHILFICSGAFHACKPSDLLAELQGRLPIRVELHGLTRDDLHAILTEPETNLIKQQVALIATEGIALRFTDSAVAEIAEVAAEINRSVENIGARRLHTVIERIVEDISFNAPDMSAGTSVLVDADEVRKRLGDLLTKTDLSKFVL